MILAEQLTECHQLVDPIPSPLVQFGFRPAQEAKGICYLIVVEPLDLGDTSILDHVKNLIGILLDKRHRASDGQSFRLFALGIGEQHSCGQVIRGIVRDLLQLLDHLWMAQRRPEALRVCLAKGLDLGLVELDPGLRSIAALVLRL